MPQLNEIELKKKISSGDFMQLYFLYGDEKYLIRHYTSLILKKIINPDFADFNFHKYDGKDINFDEVGEAVEALPMMSDYTLILIKDLAVDSLNADMTDKFLKLISDIPETTVILISNSSLDVNVKSAKGKKILSEINRVGCSVDFAHAGLNDLIKLIEKGASSRGCSISSSNARYLLTLIGDDMTVIINELDKLCAYKKDGEISKQDIDAVVVKTVQARVFDLAKALTAGNCDLAMEILDNLIAMKEEPINILGALITPYVDMYRAKVYVSGGLRAEDAAKDFNYKGKEFRLSNASRSASKYTVSQLRSFLDVLNDADRLLKSTSINGRIVLEQTITKLFLVSNGEKI
jgi:DNA polymerase-3 subunit delta